MLQNSLRLLVLVVVLALPFGNTAAPVSAAEQPGDEHWAGELAVPGFDGWITALVSDTRGNIYAGGDFTAIDGNIVHYIARWDGSSWTPLGEGLPERAHNLVIDSRGNLYTDVLVVPDSGLPDTVVMRWDGSAWSRTAGDLSSLVDTLAEGRESNILINDLVVDSQDRLYAGGYFYLSLTDRYVGYVARWDGSEWALLGSGMNHTVYHLAVDGQDHLFAGGEFTSAGGVPASRVAEWDVANEVGAGTWRALGSGLGGEAVRIADMAADAGGNLYITGEFASAGGTPVGLIAVWDGAWSDLAPGENRGWFEGEFASISDLFASPSGDLYAGGSFRSINGVEANNIARWDGSAWKPLGASGENGVNERVLAVTADEKGRVFAGGVFTQAGSLPASRFAMWDGSAWQAWFAGDQAGVNGSVTSLAVEPGGAVYAGGNFTIPGTKSSSYIARWDGRGWHDLGGGFDNAVQTLALDQQGSLYAGGDFTTAGGAVVNAIARWDGSTWSALGSGMASDNSLPQVRALALDGQGNLYAGGAFTTAGGVAANYIAKWDGSAWSPLGDGMNDQVTDLLIDSNGKLFAAGYFTQAGGVDANGIAVWDVANEVGAGAWRALGSDHGMIEALAMDAQGNLYAGGMFYLPPDGSTIAYIARWDGSTWNPLGSGVDNFVHALAVDQAGNLYASGDFSTAGGSPALRIARWDGASWSPLGSGIGAGGDYLPAATLVTDSQGNLYVGGTFSLAGGKPSANLAKWCAELQDGGCRFTFEPEASTPEPTGQPTGQPTGVPATPAPTPEATATPGVTQPAPTEIQPTVAPTSPAPAAGGQSSLWIGAGIVLAILLVGLGLRRR